MRDVTDLSAAFDLAGAQLAEPTDSGDHRIDDLVARFPTDQPLMVVTNAERDVVGATLAFRTDDGAVTLRIIGVIPAFRHRGIAVASSSGALSYWQRVRSCCCTSSRSLSR